MSLELVAQVPGLDPMFALTLVNRAWIDVQRQYLWSFLYGVTPIPTPTPINAGTVTCTPGLNTITGDANASAAWVAVGLYLPLTSRQFRVGTGTIYDIIGYNGSNQITLAQPYQDNPKGAGLVYSIYGVYYVAPAQDFVWWETVTDPVTGYKLRTTITREYSMARDPQRFQNNWPEGVIPYGFNPLQGNTLGWPRYEMWPAPLNGYTYVGSYFRSGVGFANYGSTVPFPLGEDVVLARAKQYGYEWAAANQERVQRLAKTQGFTFLMGYAEKQYNDLLNDYILKDESFSKRHMIDEAETTFIRTLPWVSQREALGYLP